MKPSLSPLEPRTRDRVNSAIDRAVLLGQDAAEYLHRYGLIAGRQWRHQVETRVLAEVIIRLAELTPNGKTPQDMYAAVMRTLEEFGRELNRRADEAQN